MKNTVNKIAVQFPSKSQNEALARSVVSAFLLPLDPTVDEIADIRCVVSEAVTNCIVHAYKNEVGKIRMEAVIYDDKTVRITITDNGCGIEDIARAREPLFTTDTSGDRSGMGFAIMESFCDKVKIKSSVGKGTKITLIKKLSS